MRKYFAIILALCMIVSIFAACDGSKKDAETNTQKHSSTQTESASIPETEPDSADESTTEPKSEKPTEPESETQKDSETQGGSDSNSETQTETETGAETETGLNFKDTYSIEGEFADILKNVIKEEKLPAPTENADLVIYVGDANADVVNAAKALLVKPNNYLDFVILSDGSDLAIYATSEYAIEQAIDYLITNHTEKGYIAVPDNFKHTHFADLPDIKIDGKTLEGFTVVAPAELQDLASGLAENLTMLSGYKVSYGTSAESNKIVLSTTDSSTGIKSGYSISYSNSTVNLSAQNKATLAYAISSFLDNLEFGMDITDGYSRTFPLTLKTEVATNTQLFKYCGTWQATDQANPTTMVSYWDAAYVEVDFSGNAITLMFSSPTTFRYRIDGGDYITISNVTGEYTVYASGGGMHTVRVLWDEKANNMYFAGVKVGAEVSLTRTEDKKYYIQFVGDSISDATNSFSHNSADLIDWDYSVIACEALSLVKDMGYWRYNNGFANNVLTEGSMAWHFKENFGVTSVGMEDAFFKLGIPNKWKNDDPRFADVAANYYTEKYDFNFATGNTPDIVFIFLGTNDLGLTAQQNVIDTFVATYKSFVAKILATYGSGTEIVIMQALSTSNTSDPYNVNSARYTAIRRVASELKELYPDNITFLDENTLFTWGVDISSDGTHPSADGYATLSEKVAKWLEKKFK